MAIGRSAVMIALVALSVVGMGRGAARAQTAPPPAGPAPPPTASPASSPPATDPGAPPPAAPTPPPATSPVAPLSPTLAPEPAPGPPLALEQRTPPTQPALDRPFYKRAWFWVGLGVIAQVIVLVLLLPGADSDGPPPTTYGNMNAF